ncbi:MAG: hypothetical protein H6682_16875 [Candidatus Eisenbacteria bacterium]|nr:hypothetical protein [Candidatus Eisenbacteria bacterium]
MTEALPPSPETARLLLDQEVRRLTVGGRKVALVLMVLFAVSKIVFALRHLAVARTMDIVTGLSADVIEVSLGYLAFHALLPLVLRRVVYRPLLEQGTVVRAEILSGPRPLHQGFGGIATQPFMIRGAASGLESLFGSWLPTLTVNYRVAGPQKSVFTGALYADEMPLRDDGAYALINPRRPLNAWLIRARTGTRS